MNSRPGGGQPAPGPECGASLIEVLVALVIMGIAFVIIVGGIGTAIMGSDLQKQQAGADIVLRTAAEAIEYRPCPATAADYQSQLGPVPGFAVTVAGVSFWDRTTNSFTAACPDDGLQLVEISAISTSGRHRTPETLRVVKRRT